MYFVCLNFFNIRALIADFRRKLIPTFGLRHTHLNKIWKAIASMILLVISGESLLSADMSQYTLVS